MMTYVILHESVGTTIEANIYIYITDLKEPVRSHIRCMRPATIEKVLGFIQEELNVMYLHTK